MGLGTATAFLQYLKSILDTDSNYNGPQANFTTIFEIFTYLFHV